MTGYPILEGKRGIITGVLDEHSIAWAVAAKASAAGARILLTNTPVAARRGNVQELAQSIGADFFPADATNSAELEALYRHSQVALDGKLDFILHSIAMSPNLRKKRTYGALDYEHFKQTIDISALSFHRMMQAAEQCDALNDHASIVAITFMASMRTFPDYGDMAQAKAVLESIARSYGYQLGKTKKARVNTICQGPVPTTAGKGVPGFDALSKFTELMAPLGNPSVDACADYIVTLFSDYTRSVTMQCLYHDGGFSAMGMSTEVADIIGKAI